MKPQRPYWVISGTVLHYLQRQQAHSDSSIAAQTNLMLAAREPSGITFLIFTFYLLLVKVALRLKGQASQPEGTSLMLLAESPEQPTIRRVPSTVNSLTEPGSENLGQVSCKIGDFQSLPFKAGEANTWVCYH